MPCVALPVVVNRRSGGGIASDDQEATLRPAFEAAGRHARLDVSLVDGPAIADAVRRARDAGAKVVAVAGGDGTVSTAAQELAGSATALAVLPMGTMNHFAKDAGIPLALEDAVRVAVRGRATPIDVAEANGRVFVNNASIGVYPRAVHERSRLPTPRTPWGKRLAQTQAALAVLRRWPAHRVLLAMDGHGQVRTPPFIFVGNNVYDLALGRLGTRRSLTGGRLGVYHSLRPERGAVLALAARALVGRLEGSEDLQQATAQEVAIHALRRPGRRMRVGVDGEVVRMRMPLRFRIRPRDLLVMRPRGP